MTDERPLRRPSNEEAYFDVAASFLAGALLSAAFTAAFEWNSCIARIDPSTGTGARMGLAWVLVARTMLFLVPGVVAGAAAAGAGWRRAWPVIFTGYSALLCFGLLVDLRVQAYTGDHLLHYLQFIDNNHFGEWGGGLAASFRDGALFLGGLAAAAIALLVASRRLVAMAAPQSGANLRRASATAYALVLVAALLLHRTLLAPAEVTAFEASMPVSWPGSASPSDQRTLRTLEQRLNEELAGPLEALRTDPGKPAATDRTSTLPAGSPRPDVIVLVLESFRSLSFTPDRMPRLFAWSRRGLHLDRHFSGSNCSHLGMYSLMYGRIPWLYDDAIGEPPQLPASLKASGYRTTYTSSMDHRGWMGMGDFLSESTFDEMTLFPGSGDRWEWPDRDRQTLDHVRRLLDRQAAHDDSASPRLIVAFLASTHYPYMYPPEYERHLPVLAMAPTAMREDMVLLKGSQRVGGPAMESIFRVDAAAGREGLLHRYENAAGFLDDRIADLLEQVDLDRTVVVVTGDHGESLWDDGTLAHGLRPSEVQARVPFLLLGPGVEARAVAVPTSHVDALPTLLHAVAGTSVKVRGLHGRDLLDTGSRGDHIAFVPLGDEKDLASPAMVLVAPEGRLSLRWHRQRAALELRGALDERGAVADAPPVESGASRWAPRIAATLDALAR